MAPVNQSFQTPAVMSRVETTWAVMKSLSSLYTSMPLWLCTNTMDSRKPADTCATRHPRPPHYPRPCFAVSSQPLQTARERPVAADTGVPSLNPDAAAR